MEAAATFAVLPESIRPAVVGFQGRVCTESWTPAEVKAHGVEYRYTLTKDLVYVSPAGAVTIIPAGFETDLASIPRFAFRYINPWDKCMEAPAVLHDFRYTTRTISRREADAELVESMALCGARWDQQQVVYAAVRMFGSSHWNA